MRNYFFIVTRADSTKFMVTKSCEPNEVNEVCASLANNNFACAFYCLEDYKDSIMFMRSILNELNFTDVQDYESYIKKDKEEEELWQKWNDAINAMCEDAEKSGDDSEIELCEEVGGAYTITGYDGDEYSRFAWCRSLKVDEWGEVFLYSESDRDYISFSKFQNTVQVEIIKTFLKTISDCE